jgi:hypothetical protein
MFSNRVPLSHVAALSFLLALACSKQNEESENGGAGATLSTTTSVIGNGGTTGNNTLGGGANSNTDPNLVGGVVQLSDDQVTAIETSACNAWAIEPESVPGKLQLVVDVSSSMGWTPDGGDTGATKWEITRDALVEAVCGVNGPGLGAGMAVGLMFYPNMINENVSRTAVDQSVCLNLGGITPMDTLGDNGANTHRTLLRQRLTQAVLGRGTPTADAYEYALNHIALSPEQLAFPGDTYMLLITDGMPTLQYGCFNPAGSLQNLPGDEVVELVDGAFNQGVKTFIIGSPGSEEGLAWLSMAAFLGGTGKVGCNPNAGAAGPLCHMDMTAAEDFSTALREGLSQVVAAVSSCKYEIPASSADGLQTVDPNKVSPIISFSNGSTELVTRDNANGANCTEGYYLVSATQLQLCPNTCARFQADATATMQLVFGCATTDIINVIQ